ncbi:acidic leucine-rich nuclear phospho 32 family member B-like isoform X1 [Paramuricea clavata]|uniref:Acidic leucine-rich nuclear phospho 32 family member B-like isoform X1 n=1 Tax=Paramuricea clavata TaxID=317549 RepID=A0A6S7KEA1_PARCT|nr:acidic leucine-rich nuclear phospho 32 family member B-like isoform X1 [Paramuricea clavata]
MSFSMEQRIQAESRGFKPNEVLELNLDNCRTTGQVEGLTESFINLDYLSLNNAGLTSLKNFPKLPNLRRLELSDNRISSGLHHLQGFQKLTHLNLSGNKIKDLETLKPLAELANLKSLDLYNCEVTNVENYRSEVFKLCSSLKYLDGYDKFDKEADETDSSADDDDDDEGSDGGDDDDVGEDDDEDGLDDDLDDEENEVDDNEDDDDDNEDEDDDDDDDDDDDADDETGLEYLQRKDLQDEEDDGDDFEPLEDGEEDDDEDDDDDADEGAANPAADAGVD